MLLNAAAKVAELELKRTFMERWSFISICSLFNRLPVKATFSFSVGVAVCLGHSRIWGNSLSLGVREWNRGDTKWWWMTFTKLVGEPVWETKVKEKKKNLICFENKVASWRILFETFEIKMEEIQLGSSSTYRQAVFHICEIFMHEVWESVGRGGGGRGGRRGSVRSANRGSSDFDGPWQRHAPPTLWFLF